MNTHHLRPERPGPDRLDGRYRLVEPLGRGGTSEVWRGLDERLSRPVAVKILHGRGNDWMRNEAQALALLTHPHIATVYDYGYSQRRHYLVMELDRGPLPWSAAVRSCAQVASALAVAHARGVVHRDVTPGNIMLTAAGVKLIDFGISALAGDRETTVDGELYGTPPYAAPERLHSSAVAPAVDVFALGVVLYRAVSGCLPWHAHTAEQLVAAQRNADPADLPAVAGLPDEVGDVCMRCLARDPAERPSAAELAALLATTIPDTVAIPDTVELAEPSIEPLTGVEGVTGLLPMTLAMPRDRMTAPARARGSRGRVRQAVAALAVPAAAALAWFGTGIGPSGPPLPREAVPPPAAQAAIAAPSQEVPPAAAAPTVTPAPPAGRPKPGPAPARPGPKDAGKAGPKHTSAADKAKN
jgi:serine/threonine-protein kinase